MRFVLLALAFLVLAGCCGSSSIPTMKLHWPVTFGMEGSTPMKTVQVPMAAPTYSCAPTYAPAYAPTVQYQAAPVAAPCAP